MQHVMCLLLHGWLHIACYMCACQIALVHVQKFEFCVVIHMTLLMLDTVAVGSTGVTQVHRNKANVHQCCLAHRCNPVGYSCKMPDPLAGSVDEAAAEDEAASPRGTGWRTHRASKGAGTFSARCCGGKSDRAQSACILYVHDKNGNMNVDSNTNANGHGGGLNDQLADQPHHANHASIHHSDYMRSLCLCFWLLAAACWLLAAAAVLLAAGCWLLSPGCLLLSAGCCMLAAGC